MARGKATELERAFIALNEGALSSKEMGKKLGLTTKCVEGIMAEYVDIEVPKKRQPQTELVAVEPPTPPKKENKMKGRILHKTDSNRKVAIMTQNGSEFLDEARKVNKAKKFDASYMGKPFPEED